MKYRIVKHTNNKDSEEHYTIQMRILFIWFTYKEPNMFGNSTVTFDSLFSANNKMKILTEPSEKNYTEIVETFETQ